MTSKPNMYSTLLAVAFSLAAASAMAFDGPQFTYKKNVTVSVGQSVYIHAWRGDCGKVPNKKKIALPASLNGKLSFGEMGWRNSGGCGGPTPAIGIVYTATKKGREQLVINGDEVNVRVK